MAKIKGYIAKLEDVDESLRGFYVEDKAADGTVRFKLDADEVQDVTGLRNTVSALRTENKALKKKAEPLEELGEDDDVEALIAAGRAELERQRTGKPIPEVETVRTTMQKAHEKEVTKLRSEIDGMNATLEEVLIENEVRAVSSDPTIKANAVLLMPHIRQQTKIVKVEDDAGKVRFEARAIDPKTKQERVDGKGNPLNVRGLVAELKGNADYADAFQGSGASGSGAPTDGGSGMPTPANRTTTAPAADAKQKKQAHSDYRGAI